MDSIGDGLSDAIFPEFNLELGFRLEQLEELLVSDGEGPRPDSSTSSPGDENNNPCRSASASVGVGNGIGVNRADCMTRCASTPGYTAPTGVVGPQMTPLPTSLPKPKPKSPVETSTPASTSANPVSVLQVAVSKVSFCAENWRFREYFGFKGSRNALNSVWCLALSARGRIECELRYFGNLETLGSWLCSKMTKVTNLKIIR